MNDALRISLERMFDRMLAHQGHPTIHAVPDQTPGGLTYDPDLDAWVADDGTVPDPGLYTLTMYAIPALWGADAESFLMTMGGLAGTGDLVAIAKAAYQSQLDGAMMVRVGSETGDKYNITDLENAPDGGAAVFVIATLRKRES